MYRRAIAQRYAQEGPGVDGPPVLQQCKEEVRPEAHAGMPNNANFVASQYHTYPEGGGDRGEMAIHADKAIMLNEHLQTARAAALDS